jgi:hypothetical protein
MILTTNRLPSAGRLTAAMRRAFFDWKVRGLSFDKACKKHGVHPTRFRKHPALPACLREFEAGEHLLVLEMEAQTNETKAKANPDPIADLLKEIDSRSPQAVLTPTVAPVPDRSPVSDELMSTTTPPEPLKPVETIMIVKFSQNHPINKVDPLLIPRAIREMEEGAAEYGIKAVGAVKQGVRIDTRKVKDSAALQQWLEIVSAGTPVLVTAEPSDLKVLCDNHISPEAVGLMRQWPEARFTDLLPEELTPAVRASFFDSYTGEGPHASDELGAVMIKQIEDDLAAVGLPIPKSTNALEMNLVRETPLRDNYTEHYGTDDPTTSFDSFTEFGA